MKKFTSILISLAMALTLFAAVPAFADTTPTGAFNIPDLAQAVSKYTDAYFIFDTALSAEEQANVTATINYLKASNGADVFAAVGGKDSITESKFTGSVGGVKLTWNKDGSAVKIERTNSSGETYSNPWTPGSDGYGRAWMITVSYNGTVIGKVRFGVSMTRSISAIKEDASTTFTEGSEIERTTFFQLTTDYNTYTSRGETIVVDILENETTAYTAFEAALASGSYKNIRITPTANDGRWGDAKRYDATLKLQVPIYAAYLDADKNPVVSGYEDLVSYSWTFTTPNYDPDAVEYADEPAVTFADGVATITNNTAADVSDAILILVEKDSTTKLISDIFVSNPFSLASLASTTQAFALADGKEFDYFLFSSKLTPLISKN